MSMPQLRELVDTLATQTPSLQIAIASSEPDDVFLPYVKKHGLAFSERVHLGGTDAQLERMVVPSLLAVDAAGTVRHSWLGALSEARVSEVLTAVDQVARSQTAQQQ